MGMTITIRIDRTEMDPQGIKELLAMACEYYGYGVRVLDVREDRPTASALPRRREERPTPAAGRQESLFGKE